MKKPLYRSFEQFFPYYLSQHSRAVTRWMHVFGTTSAVAIGATAVVTRRPKLALLAPVVGYGAAWLSHLLFEHNQPVSLQYPLWSVGGDFRMGWAMARGRLWQDHTKLGKAAQDHQRERPTSSVELPAGRLDIAL